jgi:hypothetical protein
MAIIADVLCIIAADSAVVAIAKNHYFLFSCFNAHLLL